jgi:hypothetical protein
MAVIGQACRGNGTDIANPKNTNLSALNNAPARGWRWISGHLRSIRLRD